MDGTGNLKAEHNLEVTTSSHCCGRRWCSHEDWSNIDVSTIYGRTSTQWRWKGIHGNIIMDAKISGVWGEGKSIILL